MVRFSGHCACLCVGDGSVAVIAAVSLFSITTLSKKQSYPRQQHKIRGYGLPECNHY